MLLDGRYIACMVKYVACTENTLHAMEIQWKCCHWWMANLLWIDLLHVSKGNTWYATCECGFVTCKSKYVIVWNIRYMHNEMCCMQWEYVDMLMSNGITSLLNLHASLWINPVTPTPSKQQGWNFEPPWLIRIPLNGSNVVSAAILKNDGEPEWSSRLTRVCLPTLKSITVVVSPWKSTKVHKIAWLLFAIQFSISIFDNERNPPLYTWSSFTLFNYSDFS
jgi:hypothetical protein